MLIHILPSYNVSTHVIHVSWNFDTVHAWATKENTPFGLPNSCPPLQPMPTTRNWHMPSPSLHVHYTTRNNIWTTQHNKAVWAMHRVLCTNFSIRDKLLTNVDTQVGSPLENTIPTWLYPCFCTTRPCQFIARLKCGILIITTTSLGRNTHYTTQNLSLVHWFTFYQDRGPTKGHPTIKNKNIKARLTHYKTLDGM